MIEKVKTIIIQQIDINFFDSLMNQIKLWRLYKKKLLEYLMDNLQESVTENNSDSDDSSSNNIFLFNNG